MEKTLINLIPETAKYIGDFYKENEHYFFTIEVPKETSIEFKTKEFEIVSIENKISVSCIDTTNENQFYNEQDIANGFSNELSWKQIRKYKRKCNK